VLQDKDDSSYYRPFFNEIIQSISDVQYSRDGRFIVARDYLTLKVWDVNMDCKPLMTVPIHEHLKGKLSELYENDCIFDKFEASFSYDSSLILTGSYSNYLSLYEAGNASAAPVVLHADKSAFRAKKTPTKNKPMGPLRKQKDVAENVDFGKKILHAAWHPSENSIAVAATNNLFIFTQLK
jgi:serine/threonine-protein phosphatase 2A regulatory subunit B